MEILVSKKFFIRIVFGLLLTLSANAATCSKSYTLGFFNGVWNTEYESFDGTQAVRGLIGNTYNNEPVKYESFYNHTGSSVGATSLQDLAETFIQRANEIDKSGQMGKRFEYFWEFLGSSEPTFLDKLAGFLPNAASLFDSVYTAITTKLTSIISFFLSNPPTEADYAAHNARLDALATDGEKLMLVGHSQGNLFMNHAYDHILPVVTKDRVAAAHIAPASPTLRGDWVLANIDLVINAMRIQGANSVPDINLTIPVSKLDVSGHTLIGTYLDPTRDGRGKVKTMIETGMATLFCNPLLPGHNVSDFLPDGLIAPLGNFYDNTRGCASSNIPDGYITFYRRNDYNGCAPNYTFAYKNAEVCTCVPSNNFTLIGSMKASDFFKIAIYTGEINIYGGTNTYWTRRIP